MKIIATTEYKKAIELLKSVLLQNDEKDELQLEIEKFLINRGELPKSVKYHTDPTGKCEVLCGKRIIAKAYVGFNNRTALNLGEKGYSIKILQGMNREETMKKIREDCPEFLIANDIPENYHPFLFSK
jgi:lipopolysaccharide biosynthesis regulator YciM